MDGFLVASIALAGFALWVLPVWSSFWLDETATFWVMKDGLLNAISRSLHWPGQSPIYCVFAWLAFTAGGSREFVLRIPSLIAMAAAAFLLYRVTARLFDEAAAPLAVVIFVCSQPIAFAAADARPYALAICLLMAAAFALLQWIDSGRLAWAAVYSLCTALTVATHYFFLPVLALLGLYGMWRVAKQGVARLAVLAASWVACGILLLPFAAHFLGLFRNRASHTYASAPHFLDFLSAVAPPAVAAPVALGLLLSWMISPRRVSAKTPIRENVFFVAGWSLLPLLVYYLISIFTDTRIFVPRYTISSLPAMAMLVGWVVRSAAGVLGRRIVAASLVLGSALAYGTTDHAGENWRGAMQTVRSVARNSSMPVLIASGFVEAADPSNLAAPDLKDVLLAPVTMYPAAGRVIPLPYQLDQRSNQYLESVLPALIQQNRFLFIATRQGLNFEPWLRIRLASRGFVSESLGDFGKVHLLLFRIPNERIPFQTLER